MITESSIIELAQPNLYMKESIGKGRGIYAKEKIRSNTLISISPVLLFPDSCGALISPEKAILNSYTYTWDKSTQALALGLGSLYNHSKMNNVGFYLDKQKYLIRHYSICDIEKDTELCIDYGPKLWFKDVEKYDDCETTETFLDQIEL